MLPVPLSSSSLCFRFQSDLCSAPSIPMAATSKEKGKKPLSSSSSPPAIEPAIGRSLVLNLEALGKVCPALASSFNECGKTMAWPPSYNSIDRTVTEVRFFVDALWAGLVPPFSTFFNVVLSHHQIHMMHLHPQSITLLDVFAFVCEAMVGIAPSVALLRHFFSLHLTDPLKCSGCVSFQAVAETAASGIILTSRLPRVDSERSSCMWMSECSAPCSRLRRCLMSPIQAGATRDS